jgi:hypothetical protein
MRVGCATLRFARAEVTPTPPTAGGEHEGECRPCMDTVLLWRVHPGTGEMMQAHRCQHPPINPLCMCILLCRLSSGPASFSPTRRRWRGESTRGTAATRCWIASWRRRAGRRTRSAPCCSSCGSGGARTLVTRGAGSQRRGGADRAAEKWGVAPHENEFTCRGSFFENAVLRSPQSPWRTSAGQDTKYYGRARVLTRISGVAVA